MFAVQTSKNAMQGAPQGAYLANLTVNMRTKLTGPLRGGLLLYNKCGLLYNGLDHWTTGLCLLCGGSVVSACTAIAVLRWLTTNGMRKTGFYS
jgi:hypothetical protein